MSKELIIALIHQGHDGLVRTFNAVPDDKLNWKPLDNGRTALDLFGETAQICQMVTSVIRDEDHSHISYEMFAKFSQERAGWSKEEALAHLETKSAALYAALETLTEEQLAAPVTLALRGGTTLPLANWIMMSYRTFISRFAQINYIQRLYGDHEMH